MHLVIRADGGPDIGYGHLVRSGALAEVALDRGDRVTYLTTTPESVRDVCPAGVEVAPLPSDPAVDEIRGIIEELAPDAMVADSYAFDERRQQIVSEVVSPLAVILDDTRFTLNCDLLINGNVHASSLQYEWAGSEPEWCLGTEYLLLRPEFATLHDRDPPWRDPPKRAIVLMGGSDIRNATPTVLRAFDGTAVEITTIVGPGYKNQDGIRTTAASVDADISVVVEPEDLPERMFDADFAVSATGSTIYELLTTGTPTIGVPQAANQEPIATALADRDAIDVCSETTVVSLSRHVEALMRDESRRQSLRETGRELVDARGQQRLYRRIAGAMD
jgi:UDP-2,4-diacetamido-2,4,6-trideoxy-beta-L-altropyranose hydrolase